MEYDLTILLMGFLMIIWSFHSVMVMYLFLNTSFNNKVKHKKHQFKYLNHFFE